MFFFMNISNHKVLITDNMEIGDRENLSTIPQIHIQIFKIFCNKLLFINYNSVSCLSNAITL